MLRALHLTGVGPAPRLSAELGQRLNVFAGDNGLGKSFVLEVVWWALTGTWAELPAWPRQEPEAQPEIAVEIDEATLKEIETNRRTTVKVDAGRARLSSAFDFSRQEWEGLGGLHFSDKPLPAVVLYARADGSCAVWDPARNYYKLLPAPKWGSIGTDIWQGSSAVRRPQSYRFSQEALWNGLHMHDKTICNGLIQDWVSWQRQRDLGRAGETAFEQLERTLEILSPHPDKDGERIRPSEPVRVFVDDTREFPTIDFGYGSVPVIHAAAGMRRVLSLAYLLVWAWREHLAASKLLRQDPVRQIVFLMDEVETHLHPEWQRRIVPALLRVFSDLDPAMQVQAFLTTHSPLVLASLEPLFEPARDSFFVFELERGAVHLRPMLWARQGDAMSWLVSPAFNLQQARSVDAERAIEDAEALMRGEEPTLYKSREAIDEALHRLLAGDDEFWPRWIVGPGEAVP